MHIYFKVQSTCDIHSYISFTRDTEIEDSSRSLISNVRDKLARVPVTFEDRSFWKPMRRDGGDRRIPRSPWPMPGRFSFTPLSSDRFQDWDTDNADDRCRTRRTENRWWQCDGVEHRRRLIYLVGRHVLVDSSQDTNSIAALWKMALKAICFEKNANTLTKRWSNFSQLDRLAINFNRNKN